MSTGPSFIEYKRKWIFETFGNEIVDCPILFVHRKRALWKHNSQLFGLEAVPKQSIDISPESPFHRGIECESKNIDICASRAAVLVLAWLWFEAFLGVPGFRFCKGSRTNGSNVLFPNIFINSQWNLLIFYCAKEAAEGGENAGMIVSKYKIWHLKTAL